MVIDQAEFILQFGKRRQIGFQALAGEERLEKFQRVAKFFEADPHAVTFCGTERGVIQGQFAGAFASAADPLVGELDQGHRQDIA